MRAVADVGTTGHDVTVIATRGEHLILTRQRCVEPADAEPFHIEMLDVIEINTDKQIARSSCSTPTTSTPPIAELDARYLAGEAAAHAHTWSVIAGASPRSTDANFPRRPQIW